MRPEVDLSELAVDRGSTSHSGTPPWHLLTRYLLPGCLLVGFLALAAWAARDYVFPPHPVTVVPVFSTTAAAQREGTPLFSAAGWIEPRPTPVRVAALAPGVVEKLLVVEDQLLKQGDVVAELVKEDVRLALERAQAELELRFAERDAAQAALTAAQTRLKQPVHLEATFSEAEAALARIQTALQQLPFEAARARADLGGLQKAYDSKRAAFGAVAGVEIAIAKSKRDVAKTLVEELQNRSAALKQEHAAMANRRNALRTQRELLADEIQARDEAQAKVKATEARVVQARVVVAETQLRRDRMTIVAPVDGRVFRLIAHPGTRIGSGTTQMQGHDSSTVITMYQPQQLQVRVDVRFEDIRQVRLGQPVAIDNAALSAPLTGEVLFVSSEADIQKNTLQVKVALLDPPQVLKPEMLVDVKFLATGRPTETTPAVQEIKIYIPRELVQQSPDGSFVWVADQSAQRARRVAIQTVAGTQDLIEVISGLEISSRLISNAPADLEDSDRIRVTGEDATIGTSNKGTNNVRLLGKP